MSFTVNSPGTVALCGFADQKSFKLGDFEIKSESPYCMIFITATEKGKTLKESKSILITTIARARNSGMKTEVNGRREPLLKRYFTITGRTGKVYNQHKISKEFSVRILIMMDYPKVG
jgi:hypothetical protein